MNRKERDELARYIIDIQEKAKSDENTILPLLNEIEAKIITLEEQRKIEKQALIDYIDNFRTILLNMPVETEEIVKKRWWEK